ncbi:MAG: pilus assembly protein TadG-related protein [Hyphomicrobiaceae bacterium]|nr:pilus assembly protein TadG-related protein [Hyphomicrobiaceae bacterium]
MCRWFRVLVADGAIRESGAMAFNIVSRLSRPIDRETWIQRVAADRAGAVIIKFALSLPVLLFLVGNVVDHARYLREQKVLQSATDAAALAAAKEISITNLSRQSLDQVARDVVSSHLAAREKIGTEGLPQIATEVLDEEQEIHVRAEKPFEAVFGDVFGYRAARVRVRSVAQIVGKPNICVLALEDSEPSAIHLQLSARMLGRNCAVFSNSTSPTGLSVLNVSSLVATTVCSAGGVAGAGAIAPRPLLDCPQFEDPLAGRTEPNIGPCDHVARIILLGSVTLEPGTYCGGLTIGGAASVTLEPGVYTITGGVLAIAGLARVKGEDVSIYLGPTSALLMDPTTSIELSAARQGELAGLLFFGSRRQSKLITHTILSRGAQKLVGTIYLPQASLVIDGNARVGAESAYTAIVARRVVLLNTPHVVLNTNYDETDVPVPEGIRGAGQPTRLVQ